MLAHSIFCQSSQVIWRLNVAYRFSRVVRWLHDVSNHWQNQLFVQDNRNRKSPVLLARFEWNLPTTCDIHSQRKSSLSCRFADGCSIIVAPILPPSDQYRKPFVSNPNSFSGIYYSWRKQIPFVDLTMNTRHAVLFDDRHVTRKYE